MALTSAPKRATVSSSGSTSRKPRQRRDYSSEDELDPEPQAGKTDKQSIPRELGGCVIVRLTYRRMRQLLQVESELPSFTPQWPLTFLDSPSHAQVEVKNGT